MTTQVQLPRILCVDDEPRVLDSLVLILRRDYEVHIAASGEAALALFKKSGPYAVICSDMRMPVMSGAVLLKTVMQQYPETTRLLLTGEPSRDAAVDAVNEGQIFRFLCKPCAPEQLKAALVAAVKHHHLVSAERVLLQETLLGCINALVDVLAIASPVAFGRTNRVRRMVVEFAAYLGNKELWPLEAAAMLSQLGYLSLPVNLVEKLYYGQRVSSEEQAQADGVPDVAQRLLGHIPRLEPVLQILAGVEKPQEFHNRVDSIAVGARLLSLVLDYDALIAQGVSTDVAIGSLRKRTNKHDVALIAKLAASLGAAAHQEEMQSLPLGMVSVGMTFMDDLRSEFGVLLVPRGFEVTTGFCERMRNFSASLLSEQVRVLVRTRKTDVVSRSSAK